MLDRLPAHRLALFASCLTSVFGFTSCGGGEESDEPATFAEAEKRGQEEPFASAHPVTFGRDIAPILFTNCAGCHRPGASAPFSLLSFEDAKSRAVRIAAVTRTRYMPPWLPEPGFGDFAGERRLSEEQIALIQAWVEGGAREGDPKDLPPVPEWDEVWKLGEPDLVIEMTEPYMLAAAGRDIFRNFVIPIPITSTRWVKAVELRPGNTGAVHHAVMRVDLSLASRRLDEMDSEPGYESRFHAGNVQNPGGFFLGWSPGKVPFAGADDMSWRLEPGTDFVLKLHLRPTGRPEKISASARFFFADEPPTRSPALISLRSRTIDIPPGEKNYAISDSYELPVDVEVLGLYPHAHYLGKEMHGFATLPDGTRKWLLRISDWNFDWQDEYRYADPIALPKGTILSMRYTYDNSAANPQNPNHPPKRVVFGPESSDEMGFLLMQVFTRNNADLEVLNQDFGRKYALSHLAGLRQALRLNPDDAFAHFEVGAAMAEQGNVVEAIRHYREAIRLDGDLAEAHNNLGVALEAEGAVLEAIGHYREAVRIKPAYPTAHHNLGVALGARGMVDEAIGHQREAIRLRPEYAKAHYNLGVALEARGQVDSAIRHYRAAVRLEAEMADAHNNLGAALMAQGRLDEAIAHLREAARLRPDWPGPLSLIAEYLATHPDPKIRDPAAAVGLAERAAEMTGYRHPLVLEVLAAAYAADTRFREAVEAAEEAARLAVAAQAEEAARRIKRRLALYMQSKPYVADVQGGTSPR